MHFHFVFAFQDIRDLAISGMGADEYENSSRPVYRLLDASALQVNTSCQTQSNEENLLHLAVVR